MSSPVYLVLGAGPGLATLLLWFGPPLLRRRG